MSETNPLPINADDPGLTAFALGELEGPEADRYAEAVAASVELQAIVADIQSAARVLSDELQLEPKVTMSAERRAEIVAQACPESRLLAKPQRYFGLSRQTAAIAASVLLVPGAWYGFRAILPPAERKPVLALNQSEPWNKSGGLGVGMPASAPNSAAPLSGPRSVVFTDSNTAGSRHRLPLASSTPSLEQKLIEESAVTTGPVAMAGSGQVSRTASPDYDADGPIHVTGVVMGRHAVKGDVKEFDKQLVTGMKSPAKDTGEQSGDRLRIVAQNTKAVDYVEDNSPSASAALGSVRGQPSERKPRTGDESSSDDYASSGNGEKGGGDQRFDPRSRDGQAAPAGRQPGSEKSGDATSESQFGNEGQSSNEGEAAGIQLGSSNSSKPSKPGQSAPTDSKVAAPNRYAVVKGDPAVEAAPGSGGASKSPEGAKKEKRTPSAAIESKSEARRELLGKKSAESVRKSGDANFESQLAKEVDSLYALSKDRPEDQVRLKHEVALAEQELSRAKVIGKDLEADHRLGWREDPTSNESYKPIYENSFISAAQEQLSTFSIDVDTASYANLRRFLQSGQLPPPDAVRIEELVNYFSYAYPQPQDGRPFSVQTDIATCPWQPNHQLVRIGLKGKEIPKNERPPTNLVFLVDVSGSMAPANKLPLVRESLKTLVNQLDERDKIAIVTYAGEAGLRLPSTSVAQRQTILSAIDGLGSGGSTNGAAGINTAYDIAAQEFLDKGTNRVILCTDGDFNVGVTGEGALEQMIQTRAKGGVFLSIFGFGMGNLKDSRLEMLADKGNGQYGYIDDLQEANKVFIEEMMGTLVTIAKDVKIQIDFNKEAVASYRLVGYENRVMAAEDFHNDKKDAGEIGSGHTVTALYEIIPVKDLKVEEKTRWLTVKLRYKQPEATESVLFETPLAGLAGQLKLAPSEFQFAAGVAACGMLLRHSQHAGQANWDLVKELAQSGLSFDPNGHRRSFLGLVSQAESLMGQLRPASPPPPEGTVRGKYKSLLRKLNVPQDSEQYGQFNDFGFAETKSYAGSENLPAGYWVYVAPHWYIWAESTETAKNK